MRHSGKTPVERYRLLLHDFDLLSNAGKTDEARRALHLSATAVANVCCLETLFLPQVHAYLHHRESSDFKIFYFLQILTYLQHKSEPFFSDSAEKDMIDDLIEESWAHFLDEDGERFVLLSPLEKIELFRNVFIAFPF